MRIVSTAIRQSARGKDCTLRIPGVCEPTNRTVVFAHINSKWKGMGIKSPDIFGCYACGSCHRELDANKVPAEDQLRAMQETQMSFCEEELITVKGVTQ